MMRSLYSGVSGLKTHQTKMDVIGNNIANVNTVAYKSQTITFSELMYQTTQKASGPSEISGTAGVNAKQVGLGVTTGAISTSITTAGSTQTTGNAFDMKITGDAFFIVSDGETNFFTRSGSFYVDAVGNLANSANGYNVMGWKAEEDPETKEIAIVQDTVEPLRILSAANLVSEPQATTKATISGILDKFDPGLEREGKAINLGFFDNMGYSYTAKYAITATDEEGVYVMELKDVLDADNNSVLDKFDASIYTGSNDTGTAVYASKDDSYTTLDGYTLDPATGLITLTESATIPDGNGGTREVTEISPANFLQDGEVTNEDLAALYAGAFGFVDYEEFLNLTVNVYSANESAGIPTKIGDILSNSAAGTYTAANNTAASLFNGQTISVTGYATEAGKGVKISYNQATGEFEGVNGSSQVKQFNLFLQPKDEDADNPFEVISVDMTDSLNLNNEKTSTIGAVSGDAKGYGTGCALGNMTGVSVQNNGMIYGAYDNGQTKLLGQIAVATFSNAAGLEKVGDNLYSTTLNSGEFDGIGVDVSADGGYISTGVLEMSNVDLSSEFTEMITTQRGFQANSRIITVSDTLLEELVNLKR